MGSENWTFDPQLVPRLRITKVIVPFTSNTLSFVRLLVFLCTSEGLFEWNLRVVWLICFNYYREWNSILSNQPNHILKYH